MNTVLRTAKRLFAAFALAAMTLTSSAVFADAVVNSLLINGENQFQDTDAERVIDANGDVKTSGDFAVGDTIEAILRFTDVNSSVVSDNPGFGFPYQLIAYSELLIVDINTTGLSQDLIDAGVRNLVFGATGNLNTANSLADIYERTTNTPGFDTTIDPDTAIAQVTSQTLIASLGIEADSTDFWVATTLLDIGAAAAQIPGAPQAANGTFGLTVVDNPGALPVETDGIQSGTNGLFYDVVGSASAYVLDSGTNAGWLVSSNTEARFLVNQVPEPSTLALLSLGLLAVSVMRRRRS